jgi:hypothetical protein
MRFEAFQVVVVEGFDSGVLNGVVHSLGLTVGPGVIRLRQSMFDAMFMTNAIKDMWPKEASRGALSVLGQIGERHSVVGEHFVDFVWEGRDDVAETDGALHFPGMLMELYISEL